MTRSTATFTFCMLVWFSTSLFAGEPPSTAEDSKPYAGLVANPDGTPGSLMQPLIQPTEQDLSQICDRNTDVIYGRKFGTALTMDVYTPKPRTNGAGIVLVVSGGLWSGPEYRRIRLFTERIAEFVRAGYVVFAVIHCSQPKYTLVEIKDDLPRAVRFIRHHACRFNIHPKRLGMIGYSSGGHLALLAAVSGKPGSPQVDDPVESESGRLQAVVAYFPNTDLLNYGARGKLMSEHFGEQGLKVAATFDFRTWDAAKRQFVSMSPEQCTAAWRNLSPITHVSADDPPTLLVHGDQDKLVPVQQSRIFKQQMDQVGATCELLVAEGKEHGWDQPVENELERVIGWFERHLAAGAVK